jgi:hypothetical protein
MPPRPTYASTFLTLIAVASLCLAACSSSRPRDQWYGTDAGLGYVPPDGGRVSHTDLGPGVDGGAVDLAATVDGGLAVDTSIDEGD